MTSKKKILLVVGLWLGVATMSASAAEAFRWDQRVQRGQLDNGFTYYIVDGKNFGKQLSMQLVVRAGSLDETDEQSGVAHMVEHMVFKASTAHPEGVSKYMEGLGWRIGKNYNAQTNFERTLYQIATDNAASRIDAGIDVLSQIAGGAKIPADELERERQIILEEWRTKLGVRERMDRQRRAVLREGSLYPERPTIGTEASIRQQPAASLRKFYADWYRPGNMALVIVGDVDVAAVKPRIATAFGGLAPAPLPARNAADPRLQDQLRIVRLQDSESGTSQVGWISRFTVDKRQDDDGWRRRMIDRVAERSMRALVRDAAGSLPDGVSSLTVRIGELGENTASLGFSATVAVGSHQAGMRQILLMRERLRRDGVRAQDVQAELAEIHRINEQAMAVYARRDFDGWQRTLSEVVQADKALQDPQQKQAQIRAAANSITVADINARVRAWVDAPDRALFMLAPGLSPLTLPTVAEVTAEQQALARQPLPVLVKVNSTAAAAPAAVAELPEIDTDGAIVREDPLGEGVQRWTLANGDVLVWRPTPKDTVMRVVAQSDAGYRLPGAPTWQWQLAAQMGQGADLEGQSEGELERWTAAHKVKLSQQQTETRLTYSAQVASEQLGDLFKLYAARQVQSAPSMTALGSVGEQLARQSARRPSSAGDSAAREMSKLRYGDLPRDTFPEAADLSALVTQAGLQKVRQQWQQLSAQPVTYFISGPADTATVRKLAEQYLAGIPRATKAQALTAPALQQVAGYHESRMEIGMEPQGSVRAQGSQPLQWSPERAMRTAILSRIAYRQLRAELREKEAGIYRLTYKLSLEPQNRLSSELAFTAAPERLDALWATAKRVLAKLPTQLDNAMLEEEIRQMRNDESKRVLDYTAQFNRLQLSVNQYGDARYLKDSAHLTAGLTPDSVRALAQEFRLVQDMAVVKVLPKPGGKDS